jgi:hypothetical protein
MCSATLHYDFEQGASLHARHHLASGAEDCTPTDARYVPVKIVSLFYGRFGCGEDLVETRITAQIIPAWI